MKMRQLPVRVVWWLAVLFSLGVWVGIILAAKTVADVPWKLASQVNRQANKIPPSSTYNCVNYSNAKLAALIAAGVDPKDVRTEILRVRVGPVRRFHQVVVAKIDGKEMVLDNLSSSIWPLDVYLQANRPLTKTP